MNLFLFVLFTFFTSIEALDCNKIPQSFSSYREAESIITTATWKLKDRVDCSKSSWIQEASFYSCDGHEGYFLMKTKEGKSYLHKDVPKSLWIQFKGAGSFGTFYNSYFKEKYQFDI